MGLFYYHTDNLDMPPPPQKKISTYLVKQKTSLIMANRLAESVWIHKLFGEFLHSTSRKEIICRNARKI